MHRRSCDGARHAARSVDGGSKSRVTGHVHATRSRARGSFAPALAGLMPEGREFQRCIRLLDPPDDSMIVRAVALLDACFPRGAFDTLQEEPPAAGRPLALPRRAEDLLDLVEEGEVFGEVANRSSQPAAPLTGERAGIRSPAEPLQASLCRSHAASPRGLSRARKFDGIHEPARGPAPAGAESEARECRPARGLAERGRLPSPEPSNR